MSPSARLVRVPGGPRGELAEVEPSPRQQAVAVGAPMLVEAGAGRPLGAALAEALPAGRSLALVGEGEGGLVPIAPVELQWRRNAEVVDVLVLARRGPGAPAALLVRRGHPPYEGSLALPGGFVDEGEPPLSAALRELAEETGLRLLPRAGRRTLSRAEAGGRASVDGSLGVQVALGEGSPAVGRLRLARVADALDDPRFPPRTVHTYLYAVDLPLTARGLRSRVRAGDDAASAEVLPRGALASAPIGFSHHVVLIDAELRARGAAVAWTGRNRRRLGEARAQVWERRQAGGEGGQGRRPRGA